MATSIMARLGLDTSDFRRGIQEVKAKAAEFKAGAASSFGPAGAVLGALGPGGIAAAAGIGLAAKAFSVLVDESGRVSDLAGQFGDTAEGIQRVEYAAKLSGSSIEKLGGITNKLTVAALEATKGGEKQAEAFAAVGISAREFINSDLQGKVLLLAKAYDATNGDAQKQAELLSLIGAKGSEIFPILSQGAEQLAATMNEIPVISNDLAEDLDYLGDKVETLKRIFIGATASVVEFVEAAGKNIGEGAASLIYGESDIRLSDEYRKQQKKIADEAKKQQQELAQAKADAMEVEKKEADDIAKLKEKLADKEEKAAFDRLSSAEQTKTLEEQIAKLKDTKATGKTDRERVEAASDLVDKETALAKIKEKGEAEEEKTAENIGKFREKNAEAEKEAAFDRLSTAGQIKALEEEIAQLKSNASDYEEGTEGRLEMTGKILEAEKQLGDLQTKLAKEALDARKKATQTALEGLDEEGLRMKSIQVLEKAIADERRQQGNLSGEALTDSKEYTADLEKQLVLIKKQNAELAKDIQRNVVDQNTANSLKSSQQRAQDSRNEREADRARERQEKLYGNPNDPSKPVTKEQAERALHDDKRGKISLDDAAKKALQDIADGKQTGGKATDPAKGAANAAAVKPLPLDVPAAGLKLDIPSAGLPVAPVAVPALGGDPALANISAKLDALTSVVQQRLGKYK